MAKHEFKYYLHDDYSRSEWQDEVLENQIGIPEDKAEALMEKVGRPFYEVTMDCVLDDETGGVEVVAFEGKKLLDLDAIESALHRSKMDNRERWDVADVMAVLRDG